MKLISFFFRLERQGIQSYLLYHGQQAVAARRTEVFFQSYAVDEIQVGVENLVRCVTAQDPYQQVWLPTTRMSRAMMPFTISASLSAVSSILPST